MTAAARRRLVLAVGSPALVLGALAVVAVATSRHESRPSLAAALTLLISWSFVGAGLVAWTRRPENASGRLLVWVGFAWLAQAFADSNDRVVFTAATILSAIALAAFAHLLLAFPDGDPGGRPIRILLAAAYATALAANTTTLLFDRRGSCDRCPASAILIAQHHRLAEGLSVMWDGAAVAIVAAVIAVLVRRWRRSSRPARRAVAPIAYSGGLTLLLLCAGFAVDPASHRVANAIATCSLLVFATVPFAYLAGLLRSRLARAGVAELLQVRESATLDDSRAALAHALGDPELRLGVWVAERSDYVETDGRPFESTGPPRVLRRIDQDDGEPLALLELDDALLLEPELLDAAVAAARLALQRNRLQAELRARLDELRRERDFIAAVVNASPAYFCLTTPDGAVVRFNQTLIDATGIPDDETTRGRPFWEVFCLAEDGDDVRLALARADGREREHVWCGRDDVRVVAWSAIPIADAQERPLILVTGLDVTHRLEHEEELRRSRARLVEAGDAERRRLERNLHDGAQQRLVSLSLVLRLAQARLRADPDAVEELLGGAAEELTLALQELRELARGLHPAVLAARGLAAALDSLAERSSVPVELDVACEGRLPEQVEVTAFYVVSEALANVAKYAHATRAVLRVRCDGDALEVEVVDDGIGGADPARGSGLSGLVDRVDAADGLLELSSPPGGGTRIAVRLPLRPVRQAVPRE